MDTRAPAPLLPDGIVVRPMRPDDLDDAERLSDLAFSRIDAHSTGRTPQRAAAWKARTAHLLAQDGAGCWVADRDGRMVGLAVSLRRETLWALATLAVHPDWQGRGVGHVLLQAAGTHARGALRGMISSFSDPRAVRRYRTAGFDLHPQMLLEGVVHVDGLEASRHVRDGTGGDLEWMDSLDRGLRGAGRGDDHALLRATHRSRVVDRAHRRGYAYVGEDHTVVLLAASDRRTAAELLTDAWLGAAGEVVRQPHVTAANQWALDVGLAAGLSVRTEGYLCVRGLKPPTPYLHHGSLL
ncbi:GNAT family N-acetyltransferase [Nocardioides sp. Y6]|uniref:GNAT family N-acetyltransferase n=1 Tax=Nocardioides malaquae TaxID=2773426 RepID=A0ABR9RQ52_9ACTN|nr:GNAT family N-acetyltransferase [Nocardioides malaquae]MBE7323310.1 GNAT family N-acetyltransferase [Nocardioides malaquae]